MQNIVMYSKTHKVQQVSNQLYIPWRNKTFLVERCVLSQGGRTATLELVTQKLSAFHSCSGYLKGIFSQVNSSDEVQSSTHDVENK